VQGGNTFVMVAADGDDMVHFDGKTAAKAVELIPKHAGKPFFLAVGFVRPHMPFVSPRKYHERFLPYDKLPPLPKIEGEILIEGSRQEKKKGKKSEAKQQIMPKEQCSGLSKVRADRKTRIAGTSKSALQAPW
jgi:hypothetical protein